MPLNQSSGFVLTRKSYDTRKGMIISLWLVTENGAVNLNINDEYAIFFIKLEDQQQAILALENAGIQPVKMNVLPLMSFTQDKICGVYFRYLREFYQARDALKQKQIKVYEDDIRPEERYLMERFITDGAQFIGDISPYASNFPTYINVKCKQAQQTISLKMVSVDLECSPKGSLYSIGLYAENYALVMMIADSPQFKEGYEYIQWVKDEKSLLLAFLHWLKNYDPDLFIGWNVINFDFNLLQKRFDLHNIPFAIGRDGSSASWRKQKNTEQHFLAIEGRVVVDGIDLLKTATYNFTSFSLDNVATVLLGRTKKVKDVDNRLQEIVDNFHHDKHALAAYNLEDCKLVWEIFKQTKLLDFAVLRSKLTGLAMDKIGGSVAAFTNLYLPKLHRAGYVAPNLGDSRSDLVSPGGYVMDSIPGLYNNVLVLDFKSLYPSIIRTFYIDPMGLIEGLKNPEQSVEGFDDAYFSREKHFLPAIIDELWQERDKAKLEKNNALSQAIKIIMNSFYGVLGSTGCRFFDPRLSGAITKRGHQILKTTQQWIEDIGYQVIYGDTDSIFVFVGDSHQIQQARALGKQLENIINEKWNMHIKENYQVTSKLEIEFETHFSRFFMPTIRGLDVGTKKRYAGLIRDEANESNEKNSRMVFKGLETVRTDWTQLAKDFQQELYRRVFNNEPVENFIHQTVQNTINGTLDNKLIYRKRIRRKLADYQKNIPPHIRAARAADDINQSLGRSLRYQKRGWIEYVMTMQGPQAVEHQSAPLDYQRYVERQLKSVADAILPFVHLSFDQIIDNQLNLF